jgi:UPF0755 protein
LSGVMRRLLLAGACAGCFSALVWFGAAALYDAPGPLTHTVAVVVPRGGNAQTAQSLRDAGVIGEELAFRVAEMATAWQGSIRAAEFAFPAGASLDTVLAILRFGRPVQHRLTIAEGLTSAQVAQLLARDGALTGDVVVPAEGSVLPQTYDFERNAARASILGRAQAAMHGALAAAWASRAPGLPLESAWQTLVLASIVERETGLPAERPMVARVFLNRLRAGMKLQADPTAAYGAAGGLGSLPRSLDRNDLQRQDDYNTYAVPGLPAAPICNPGVAAIEAVLHPAATDALYFVADGKGGHAFADRLDEHDRNVTRFRSLPHQ